MCTTYPHRHNLSACAQPIRTFGRHLRAGPRPHIRPFAAGRSPTRERTSTHPVQNSPCSAGPSAQPVQNSPNTPKKAHFSTFCPSRENFLPHPAPRPPAGRTLYRTQHHDPQQGELCTAPSAKPGTKLSQHAPASSPAGTKLSQRPRSTAVPRKSSPSTPHTTTEPRKSSPSTKVRPAHLKTAFFASFAPAGRIFSRSHPHQAEQGELIRAEDLTGRDDGATLKPPTPLFTVDRPRSSHRLYGRHPRPRTRAPDNECHHNETRIRLRRFNRRVGGTSALLMPPTRYVENDSRKAQASLGATSSSASPRWICPLATGVIAPSFFLFVTTTGVTVS